MNGGIFFRELFEEVRGNAPAELLLDECDGLLSKTPMGASMRPSHRLLQNELKNQWSDLVYSKARVVVVGATTKSHDVDVHGFGRRLSLILYVDLPNAIACQRTLEGELERVRHPVRESEMAQLREGGREKG